MKRDTSRDSVAGALCTPLGKTHCACRLKQVLCRRCRPLRLSLFVLLLIVVLLFRLVSLSTSSTRRFPQAPTLIMQENSVKDSTSTQVPQENFVKFDEKDIKGGDFGEGMHVNSVEDAQTICKLLGSQCQAFVYTKSDNCYLKKEVSVGMSHDSETTTFIKREFVKLLKTGSPPSDRRQCIVSEAAVNWSNECRIPEMNPYDETIVKLIHPVGPVTCPGKRFTGFVDGSLRILDSAKDVRILSVTYRAVTREPHNDWGYHLGEEKVLQLENQPFKINDEFIRVDVTTEKGNHTEYHAHVPPNPDVSPSGSARSNLPLSVVIIGLDSVSSAHFQRALPEAYQYLKDELHSFIMKGNAIVGDGTTPALTALFTGKFEADLPEARRGYEGAGPVDQWPWIFKDFKARGFATFYSEDDHQFGTFNYRLHGFTEPPTHHYSRYFWEAAKFTAPYCISSRLQHRVHFDYIETFFEAYPTSLKFGFALAAALPHNSLDAIYLARYDFLRLIKKLHTRNLLNNTMLVVMSDHGFRYGETRSTLQGKLEERLPFLSITLPRWFREQFPHLIKNLENNANHLVTPFDLHATLLHLFSYPEPPKYLKWGRSLFDVIPESRDCSAAGVAEHYCPCVRWQPVDKNHLSIRQSAQAVVAHINNSTSSDADGAKLCARLELAEIISAHQKIPNVKMQQHLGAADPHGRVPKFADKLVPISDCMYQITLRTIPGNALYEVAVTYVEGKLEVVGPPSRINKYGDQPKCIQEKRPDMRKYCCCKSFCH